ncbi:hypothetical protein DXM27_05095 [Rhizobium rhizogenes]|uniref:Uncharacterized protein n=1 Tax=Rhizobium rhizogenes TaxID=359 RepID=A0AA88JRU0_RHIRH|nr:hypothetical protein DXM27_05095 [Rhizobium rhizogenes]
MGEEARLIDRYTKLVLTVIAGSLVMLVIQGAQPEPANAQTGQVHVVVDRVAPFALQFAGPLAVKVGN